MKIIYKGRMLERIHKVRADAFMERREIEKIELTVDEGLELIEELKPAGILGRFGDPWYDLQGWLNGLKLMQSWGRGHEQVAQPPFKVLGINIEISR